MKAFVKPFGAPQRSAQIKVYVNFCFYALFGNARNGKGQSANLKSNWSHQSNMFLECQAKTYYHISGPRFWKKSLKFLNFIFEYGRILTLNRLF